MVNIIEVDKLVKIYEPDVRAVDGITFHVEEGEVFGFLGPNGAGKSTTIKILTTLLRRTSGAARVDGIEVERDPAAVRRIIGYAAQDVGVDDDLTGRENLVLQCHLYHVPSGQVQERVSELLRTVDLAEVGDRRAGTYSGGMRKRLDLAMGLIHRPKLLFLDEPTTGLDPQNRRALWDYIRGLNEAGTTIFLTTQYMEEADRLADCLSIVDQGRIVAEDTPASLKAEIGSDVIQLAFKENGSADPKGLAKDVLAQVPGVLGIREYDDTLAVYVQGAPGLVPQLVRSLDAVGAELSRLSLSGPTLDDVFLKHTGRKMRVEEVRPPTQGVWGRGRRRSG